MNGSVKTALPSLLETLAARLQVLAAGGLYNRLLFCLKQYQTSFVAVTHVATSAAGLPRLHDDLISYIGNQARLTPSAGKEKYREWYEGFLARREAELSRVFPWDKYLPWLARELARSDDQKRDENFLLGSFDRVWAYIRKGGIDVNKLRLVDVIDAVKGDVDVEPPPQGETVYRYADGWTVQKLTTKEQLDAEGELLQHCVGSYYDEVQGGGTAIYSLRDPDGVPHVTTEYTKGHVVQVQARGNEFPEKHVPRLREMVMRVFDGDVRGRLLLREDPKTLPLAGADLLDADLRDANLRNANLRYANLQVANLRNADLRDADLRNANLRYANLQYANLQDAWLQGANLQGANLQVANLQDANLQDANLQDAKLQDAWLQGANLQGANITDVRWDNTTVWPEGFAPPVREAA